MDVGLILSMVYAAICAIFAGGFVLWLVIDWIATRRAFKTYLRYQEAIGARKAKELNTDPTEDDE